MAQSHLNTKELLALRDGDLSNPTAVEHLASCPVCRETFDDTRWTLLLRRLPQVVDAGPHPSADELLAFRSFAMSSPRVLEIRRHLRSCERCLAIYGRARVRDKRTAYSSPSPEVLEQVQRRFRPQTIRKLGTLFVARFGESFRALFTPEPSPHAGLTLGSIRPAPHPGSASLRKRRIGRSVDRVVPERSARGTDEAMDFMTELQGEAPESHSIAERTSSPPSPTRIRADGWKIEMTPLARDGNSLFALRLVADDPQVSVRGIPVRIAPRDGTAIDAVTDDNGETELAFRPGRSTIRIGTRPPVAVELEFPPV